MRVNTGGTGFALIAKVVENEDGTMATMLEKVSSDRTIAFVPCPGGQMKFHILYDQVSRLYWLLSTQAIDSMTRAELMPPERYALPSNERQRLQLHFTKNYIDWVFRRPDNNGEIPEASAALRQYGDRRRRSARVEPFWRREGARRA
jgi:hypothetical protein